MREPEKCSVFHSESFSAHMNPPLNCFLGMLGDIIHEETEPLYAKKMIDVHGRGRKGRLGNFYR